MVPEKSELQRQPDCIQNSESRLGKERMSSAEELKADSEMSSGNRSAEEKVDTRDAKRAKVESARSKRMADMMKQCGIILKKLMSHKHAWIFNEPVDAVRLGLQDYHEVIEKPMDFGSIKEKLGRGAYILPQEFAEDIHLTFANAMTYNPAGHDVYVMAEFFWNYFGNQWEQIQERLDEDRLKMEVEEAALVTEDLKHCQDVKLYQGLKQRVLSIEERIRSLAQPKPRHDDGNKRRMTYDQKVKLSVALENLPAHKMMHIVQILKKHNPTVSFNEDELVEVDIDSLDYVTLWELDLLVTNYVESRGNVLECSPERDDCKSRSRGCSGSNIWTT